MDRNFRKPARDEVNDSPPSESWLFAQALLGKPIPNPASAQAEARAKREQLEWLASFSTEHEAQLRRLQSAEAEARHQRELLQWLATFSTEHERELRRLQAREAEAFDAQASWERFYEGYSASHAEWAEVDHPRTPKGTPDGGQWVAKGGGSGSAGAADRFAPTSTSGQRKVVDQHSAPARMLELATAWHETNDLLRRTRQDIETLPAEIAFQKAEVAKGGRFDYIFSQSLEKLTKDLQTAKALVPQLDDQKRDLQREYTASGFDAFDYVSWTPGETRVSGRGIEQVGRAVAASGSPAGVMPTGDEFEIALAAQAVFQLGRAALSRALPLPAASTPSEAVALKPYGAELGHHIPAKKAFEGAAGYDAKAALAIPKSELERLGIKHSTVTGAQNSLYRAFAKSGGQLSWEDIARIETEALVRAGMNDSVARATVEKAISSLKEAGVQAPTRIPWGK